MNQQILKIGLIFLTAFSGGGFNLVAAAPDQNTANLVIAGSGTCLPIVTKLAKAFNLKAAVKVTIPESIGSGGAIKAVNEGSLILGLTSRPLKDAEKTTGLTEIAFAKIGVIFGVHPDVPDNNLTEQELVAIIKGEKAKWRNGKTIVVLAREDGDSTIELLKKKVTGFSDAYQTALKEKRWVTFFTDQEETQAIIRIKNSFGFTDTGSLNAVGAKIKALQFNRVKPILANIKNATYPFTKKLYFIYKGTTPSAAAQAFITFVKSPQGQKILTTNGALPTEE